MLHRLWPLLLLALAAGGVWVIRRQPSQLPPPSTQAATAALTEAAARPEPPGTAPLLAALKADLQVHRQLIVLFADEAKLNRPGLERALAVGHRLHHERQELVHQLNMTLTRLTG